MSTPTFELDESKWSEADRSELIDLRPCPYNPPEPEDRILPVEFPPWVMPVSVTPSPTSSESFGNTIL